MMVVAANRTIVRQPVHTLYGGAHLFRSETVAKLGRLALQSLQENAADAFAFADGMGLAECSRIPAAKKGRTTLLRLLDHGGSRAEELNPQIRLVYELYRRLVQKLQTEPIEDYRVDFEDGYGVRSDDAEDRDALASAEYAAAALAGGMLPSSFGIRIKPFARETRSRSERTLTLFLRRLVEKSKRALPAGFAVTIPKVEHPDEVASLASMLRRLESSLGFPRTSVAIEVMIERPSLLADASGRSHLTDLIQASDGRLRGAHLGLYDYLSALGIPSSFQDYRHPYVDDLRARTALAFAETRIQLSDGATNLIPLGVHRRVSLTRKQREENRSAVVDAWRVIGRNVEHSLRLGYAQGWDLHPSQCVPRYATIFASYLRERDSASARMKDFLDSSAKASVSAQRFDDIATGWGLLQFFARGVASGVFDDADLNAAGLTRAELETGSIATILAGRSPSK